MNKKDLLPLPAQNAIDLSDPSDYDSEGKEPPYMDRLPDWDTKPS